MGAWSSPKLHWYESSALSLPVKAQTVTALKTSSTPSPCLPTLTWRRIGTNLGSWYRNRLKARNPSSSRSSVKTHTAPSLQLQGLHVSKAPSSRSHLLTRPSRANAPFKPSSLCARIYRLQWQWNYRPSRCTSLRCIASSLRLLPCAIRGFSMKLSTPSEVSNAALG
jgi:hypothetical protein